MTNEQRFVGSADEALKDADVFIGLSVPGAVSVEAIRGMAWTRSYSRSRTRRPR